MGELLGFHSLILVRGPVGERKRASRVPLFRCLEFAFEKRSTVMVNMGFCCVGFILTQQRNRIVRTEETE
jgi:hypothetical protein